MSATDIMWLGTAGQLLLAISALRGRRWFEVISVLALAAFMALAAMDQGDRLGGLMLALAITGLLGVLAHVVWDWRRRRGESRVDQVVDLSQSDTT